MLALRARYAIALPKAVAKRAKQEIAEGQASVLDYDQLFS